ncbi:hypothetical protein M5689_009876 [Euphorbia peplus]|nr:hypothetical protein M5689_009876 [Euphorbia peplus]
MALRWVAHCACQVLGYPEESNIQRAHVVGYPIKSEQKIVSEIEKENNSCSGGFKMPLHYPRYKKSDYEKMEEWRVDLLLGEYGISFNGSVQEKREFAMGAFLWPDQYD